MKIIPALGLLAVLVMASTSQAGFIFELEQPNYTGLNPGQTVTTNLFVRATAGEAFQSLNGVAFNLVGTGGNTTIASFTRNPAWLTGSNGTPSGSTLNQGSLSGFVAPDGTGRALVGSLSFTVGSALSNTTFQFIDPQAAPVTNVSGFIGGVSTSLDSQVFASPSVSFSAVPEPSSFGLLSLVGLGFVRSRFRRK